MKLSLMYLTSIIWHLLWNLLQLLFSTFIASLLYFFYFSVVLLLFNYAKLDNSFCHQVLVEVCMFFIIFIFIILPMFVYIIYSGTPFHLKATWITSLGTRSKAFSRSTIIKNSFLYLVLSFLLSHLKRKTASTVPLRGIKPYCILPISTTSCKCPTKTLLATLLPYKRIPFPFKKSYQ